MYDFRKGWSENPDSIKRGRSKSDDDSIVLKVRDVINRDGGKLMRAIRRNRPALASDAENIIFHQDNAPSHTAEHTQLILLVVKG